MGGLSKRAYLIEHLRKAAGATLVLDSGNILFHKTDGTGLLDQDLLEAGAILDIYRTIGYDAMAVGPHDLTTGVDFVVQSSLAGMPWISANLVTAENKPVLPPWIIRETAAGRKVGILGLTAETPLPEGYRMRDWEEILPGYLDALVPTCDFVILLSNLDNAANKAIADKFPQIHLLISADQSGGNVPPHLLRNTLITQTHIRGKYLGILTVNWPEGHIWGETLGKDPSVISELMQDVETRSMPKENNGSGDDGRLASRERYLHVLREMQTSYTATDGGTYTGTFRSLIKNIPEAEEINHRIARLKKEIAEINKDRQRQPSPDRGLPAVATSPGRPADRRLVGPEKCRQCHEKQYFRWQKTAHATALASLVREQQQFNMRCLSCHVTREMPAAPEQQPSRQNLLTLPEELRKVGCESCHGPGSVHIDSGGQTPGGFRPVTERTCGECHTAEMDEHFDYRDKLRRLGCAQP